MKVKGDNYS
jgi:transposase